MSDPQVVIAKGVTLETLNPMNFSMKNDYMDNLMSTAFLVFPTAASVIGDVEFKVRKGFFSYAYYTKAIDETADAESLKFTKGLAVQFTWKGWTPDDAMRVAISLYDKKAGLRIVSDTSTQSMTVYRASQDAIYERTYEKTRCIRTRKEAA